MEAGAATQVSALEGVNAVLEMVHMAQAMFRSKEYKQRVERKDETGDSVPSQQLLSFSRFISSACELSSLRFCHM